MSDYFEQFIGEMVSVGVDTPLYEADFTTVVATAPAGSNIGKGETIIPQHNWFSPNQLFMSITTDGDLLNDRQLPVYVLIDSAQGNLHVGNTIIEPSDDDFNFAIGNASFTTAIQQGSVGQFVDHINPFPAISDKLKKVGKYAEYGTIAVGVAIGLFIIYKIYKIFKK